MLLKDFLEKYIFTMEIKPKVKREKKKRLNGHCKHFKKGTDGFCVNYTESTINLVSCISKCKEGERCEDRKYNKGTATRYT
ncbi:hypothetical protein DP144_01940 [Clostridium tetani]|uniref:hypothetical protein n=1 Tax=Clostridium tetani TaxID=1513 RepID=UPI00100A6295|nr:hypothetical protein [Clostridium tetani]RXM79592.1 hypothetical protein DP154_01935 [Clostridium tetani]RYV00406.1 hypothetical protein DP144_01940 [Clostridium tetani]